MAEMPIALYRAPVSPGALVVLTRLWAYASAGRTWVHPRTETLQAELELARGTLFRRLAELRDVGLVERRWQSPTGGTRKVAGWDLRVPCMGLSESPTDGTLTGEVEGPTDGTSPTGGTLGGSPTDGTSESPTDGTSPPTRNLPREAPTTPRSPPPGACSTRGHNLAPLVGEIEHEPPSAEDLAAIDAAAAARYGDPADIEPAEDPTGDVGEIEALADECDAAADTPSDAPTFALTPPVSGTNAPAKRLGEREAWAQDLWDRYEARRVEAIPRAHARTPGPSKRRSAHAAICRLVRYVRDTESVGELEARARVEAYALGSIAEAAMAGGEWGDRMRRWRADWHEWRTGRFDQWAAKATAGGGSGPGAGPRGGGWRGPVDPATQDHDVEVPF